MVNWVSDYVFNSNNLHQINYYKKSRKIRVNFCQKSNQNQYTRKKDDFGLTFCQYVPYEILPRDLIKFVQRPADSRPSEFYLWSQGFGVRPGGPIDKLSFRHRTKVLSHTRITWKQNLLNLDLFFQFFPISMFLSNVIFTLLMISSSLATGTQMFHHSRLNFLPTLTLKEQWPYFMTEISLKESVLFEIERFSTN